MKQHVEAQREHTRTHTITADNAEVHIKKKKNYKITEHILNAAKRLCPGSSRLSLTHGAYKHSSVLSA